MPTDTPTREELVRAGRLHWFHWTVIALSLGLTLLAWQITSNQVEDKTRMNFEREASQAVELVTERMQKYEDALWSGVAFVSAQGGEVDHNTWRRWAASLQIERKYPGILGIGVIMPVAADQLDPFVADQRTTRPGFKLHPPHDRGEHLPIVYIEPEAQNRQAVGLDMAHEDNRYRAADQARNTGEARVTGPIVLVQDAQQTPGFLLFAPYFAPSPAEAPLAERFLGMVYAPFVMRDLMQGTLRSERRQVALKISDEGQVLFDEFSYRTVPASAAGGLHKQVELSMYGRTWTVEVLPTPGFRADQYSAEPLTILLAGLAVETLLVLLFIKIARANRQAIRFADAANTELRQQADQLAANNRELEQFAYVASHDMQEPLRTVATFTELLKDELGGRLDDQASRWLGFVHEAACRMQDLVRDLLDYSRSSAEHLELGPVAMDDVLQQVRDQLDQQLASSGATLTVEPLPPVAGDATLLAQVFQNLVSNGIKFQRDGVRPEVTVSCHGTDESGQLHFGVRDNGIGIPAEHIGRVFEIFQRLHKRSAFAGTGIGLAICQRVIERHGGRIWVESTAGQGSCFHLLLPPADAAPQARASGTQQAA